METQVLVFRAFVWRAVVTLVVSAPCGKSSEWELAFLDTQTGNKIAATEVPSVGGAIRPDGKTLALLINDYEQPPTIELWDIPPRKTLRWVLGLLAIPGVLTAAMLWRWSKTRLLSMR